MNRLFGITGFLGAGQFAFLVWVFVTMLFSGSRYGYDGMPITIWRHIFFGAICAIGLGTVYAFVRYSLKDHWVALRRNTPMPSSAWRGVWGIYLFCTVMFGQPAFSMWDARPIERLLYVFLASASLLLWVHATRKGCWCAKIDSDAARL